MKLLRAILVFGLMGLWVSCEKPPPPPPSASVPAPEKTAPPSSSTNQVFLVRGVVKEIDREGKKVTIAHEQVPGYMEAMTMPFRVKEATELEGIQNGDTIWFRLTVTADESWIDKLKKEPSVTPQAAEPPQREAFRVVRDVAPLQAGDLMPDYSFTNQLGRTVRLSDFKGQALAFTFIFTRCPVPDFCPRMSKNFAEVSEKLKALPKGPTNWHLLSISFDPHFDTPEVLRGYSQAFKTESGRWDLVTGAMMDIDAITDQFELTIIKQGNDWNHKLRTVVVDANGRIQKIFLGNEWTTDALLEEIVRAAHPTAGSSKPSE